LQEHGKLSENEIIDLMKNVFATVEYLHRNNFIHGDIKPGNIIITSNNSGSWVNVSLANPQPGDRYLNKITPGYTPPELFLPNHVPNVYTDIYSLGATLYKIILGETPPGNNDLSTTKRNVSLKNLRPDISPRIAKATEKALELKPENRWGSVREFWSAMTDEPLDIKTNTSEFTEIIFSPSQSESSYSFSKLTPYILTTAISPYLNAIVDIQNIINDARKIDRSDISIRSISQKSPISVSLDGASEAIALIKDSVIPWRRKHSETMAHLLEQEKRAEIENKKAEILEKRARTDSERVEGIKQHEEVERIKLENEKLRLELQRAKVQMVIDILNKIAPNLSETDKINYVVRLLPPLDIVISSEFEISGK
jgi:serine/threonine protein kinase